VLAVEIPDTHLRQHLWRHLANVHADTVAVRQQATTVVNHWLPAAL
jgi:hypothetical protein